MTVRKKFAHVSKYVDRYCLLRSVGVDSYILRRIIIHKIYSTRHLVIFYLKDVVTPSQIQSLKNKIEFLEQTKTSPKFLNLLKDYNFRAEHTTKFFWPLVENFILDVM